jgi:ubiquitin carboxyl-terminal hydrolase 5/13
LRGVKRLLCGCLAGQTDKQVFVTASNGSAEAADLQAKIEANAIAPHRFKALIGRDHPDFSTSQQQDAFLFFSHLLDAIARSERASADRLPPASHAPPCSSLFMFDMQTRTQCSTTGAVSYQQAPCCGLPLGVPVEAATNLKVRMQVCLMLPW